MPVLEGAWFASGSSIGLFYPDTTPIVEGAWFSSGQSQTLFYGERAYRAVCDDAYTYDPIGGPQWDGTLRRDPEIIVQVAANDSPSTSTFTDEEEPALGSNVQLDMQDGFGVIMGGTVQSYTTRYEGETDQLAHDANIADYLWLLNKRRPFGCFTNVSASVVAEALRVRFAPSDFSGAGIQAGLPNITVTFDGTLDYSGCMSVICARIAGRFKVDRDKVIHLFQDDQSPGPDPIDDNNMLLMRDQPLTINRDISQLRNRVFVRGATARLMADSSIGASQLEIDGLDMFDVNGGEAIIGCDRFTYGGVQKTLVYPPPDASLQQVNSPASRYYTTPDNRIVEGKIRTEVRYSASLVFKGKESARNTPLQTSIFRVNPSFGVGGIFLPFAGFLPVGPHSWIYGLRSADGGVLYDVNIGATGGGGSEIGAQQLTVNLGLVGNDYRPAEVVLWRKADILDGDPGPPGTQNGWYYEVDSQPYVPGHSSYTFIDGKDDASLGNAAPWDDGLYAFQRYDTMGVRVLVSTLAARNSATNAGASQLKIYREEKFNGPFDHSWTDPVVCMTFNTTVNITTSDPTEHEDTKATTAHLYAFGETPSNEGEPVPPPPQPKVRLVLFGVSGLDEAHLDGDEVSIFIQRDDLTSQVQMATIEGGDGLHEYMVVDTNLRSNAELAARGDAELELFAQPIITVQYSTFDSKHTPGATVEFNLSRPLLVATLKVTEVRIDKVHYEHGHVARYNVTASSVRFTLQDLLRRTVLRPY